MSGRNGSEAVALRARRGLVGTSSFVGSAIAIILVAASTAARANWEYTRWGMTPDEVIAASGGKRASGKNAYGERKGATARWMDRERSYKAEFYFVEDGLARVTLRLTNGPFCALTQMEIEAKYGTPLTTESNRAAFSWAWEDRDAGNHVKFINTIMDLCEIQYSPLA